jgi:bifunctional DNA-binding transcriptional regulator/antitoxin component of YhaV-PrlF toxin-antitoxin module
MTTTVKTKTPLTVPQAVRRQAGFKAGDVVEFKAAGGVITILPKLPTADGEYTPEQRRIINARLDEAEKGPYYGPFKDGAEVAAFLRKRQQGIKPAKSKKSR